jgi:glycosyltransferase involved in cell wall biosynthesis
MEKPGQGFTVVEMNSCITLFLPSLRGGGAERVAVTLANGFATRGKSIDLVLAKAEGPYLADLSEKVRVVDLHCHRVLASLSGLAFYLRRRRPTALLSLLSHANIIAFAACRLSMVRTRHVISEHSNMTKSLHNATNRRDRLMAHFARLAYPHAFKTVAVSLGVAGDLSNTLGLPREKIQVIYNPIVTEELLRHGDEIPAHPWFAKGAPPVILGVGRLTPAKDFPTLIRAFAILRPKRSLRLMILGEGDLRKDLEREIRGLGLADHVALPGFVNNPYAFMQHASMFVLSSRWEGLPTVLIEAMACGTPVVSTDCSSGPSEILEGGKWGRLVSVGNAEALAMAIEKTLDDDVHPDVRLRAQAFRADSSIDAYLETLLGSEAWPPSC